jgi:hypothetical protein
VGSVGVRIEERVFQSIDLGAQGRFEAAMQLILPAIEATAKSHLKKSRIGRGDYKRYLLDYVWLLEAFGLPGINLMDSKFPSIPRMNDGDDLIEPNFTDLIYHVFRCSYAHGQDISEHYTFHRTAPEQVAVAVVGLDGSSLRLPESVFWSLVACVVFSKINASIETVSEYFLTWDAHIPLGKPTLYRFDIDLFWGAEDTVKTFFEKMSIPRVTMDFRDIEEGESK